MAFAAKYTQQQREAVIHAYERRGIRPAARVAALAAGGELRERGGGRVDPFAIPEDTVRSMAREARRKRAGLVRSQLLALPAADATERLRQRLVNAMDAALTDLESRPVGSSRNLEDIRQLARALRELAALPEPSDPAPRAPGAKVNGQRVGGETRGGLAGAILADVRASYG